jgi:ABC-type branched-subunit amino acid transport system ATPase component
VLNSYYGDIAHPASMSLRVEKSEVVALLGRNGAGKSTTAQEPDGRSDAEHRLGEARRAEIAGEKSHAIARAGMQLVHAGAAHLRQPRCRGKPVLPAHGAAQVAARTRLRHLPAPQRARRKPRH